MWNRPHGLRPIERLLPLALLALVSVTGACGCDPPPTPTDGALAPDAVDDLTAGDLGAPDAGSDLAAEAGADLVNDDLGADGQAADGQAADGAQAGSLTVLSYNIAGLPFGLSQSDPVKNTPLISPLLNAYALALLQEDFAFTTQLASQALHPYKSTPGVPAAGTFMNDGLTRFSTVTFSGHMRVKWTACNGVFDAANDCLASKGFSVARTELGPGVELDAYNLHMEAGGSSGDQTARAAQVNQLLTEIASRSAGQAIIVAGDTNLKPSKSSADKQALDKLLLQAGLTDACVALSCGETDRIDRVMYRGSAVLKLEALSWKVDPSFVDSQGKDLSDHEAVSVLLSWQVVAPGGG